SSLLYKENIDKYSTSVIQEKCREFSIDYKTLDIAPEANCDFTASIEDLSNITSKFDVIILLGIIEHVEKIWKVPQQIYNILNDKGKVFINTPFMMKVH